MILRFQSREGQFRLTVEPEQTFTEITPQIAEKLPANIDLATLSVSNKPRDGDSRLIQTLRGITFKQVGLT